ncbi:hypothetical protein ACIBBB_11225 [Streptomyces sp. NPDC051217]|uniref:hypothetical protein n=1 Tax=Streptomyces sp. NPDC051217 TaxID=3365644 RepID=UPI0037B4C2B6
MDDRWSGTGGPGNTGGPADAPGYGPGQGYSPSGYGQSGYGPPGYGPPGFGPPEPFAPPESAGRAARRYLGAYVASGILLIVFACVLGAWIADTAINVHVDADGLLESLVMNDAARPLLIFTAHEWAFTVALFVVGIAALARRRLARGAALLLAFLLLGVGARQIGGLTRTEYRDVMFATQHGALIVLTYVFAFLAAAAVITLMLVARERDVSREPVTGGRRAAGVLLILMGAVQGFWYARNLREFNEAVAPGGGRGAFSEWWHELLNINARGGYGTSAGFTFYHSALIAAFLVVGVLLLRDTPAARGAALALLGIAAYLQLRDLAGVEYDRLPDYYRDATVGWSLTSSFAAGAAMLVAIALTRRVPHPHIPPRYPTAPLP